MARQLKVFRTPIGFHDAYVAAPSMKAALDAWGASRNLFAQGAAEQVTDVALMRAPLAQPGKVIKVSRGSDAQHIAAAGRSRGNRATVSRKIDPSRSISAEPTVRPKTSKSVVRKPKPLPRPSRDALGAAERAFDERSAAHEAALADPRQREDAIAREHKALERSQAGELARLERARERAFAAYRKKLSAWRERSGSE